MRIIAGKYHGKKLISPIGQDIRPTTDKIKESVFNILQFNIADKTVLDLFAGSGALGIEAISRGAKKVIFIDNDSKSIGLINKNLSNIDFLGEIIKSDALRAIYGFRQKFDIVFIDPPYNSDLGEQAITAIIKSQLLNADGFIVYEHDSKINTPSIDGTEVFDSRNYGNTTVDFIKAI